MRCFVPFVGCKATLPASIARARPGIAASNATRLAVSFLQTTRIPFDSLPGRSHKAFCHSGTDIDFFSKTTKAAVPQTVPPEVKSQRCWRQVLLAMKPEPVQLILDGSNAAERIKGMPSQVLRCVIAACRHALMFILRYYRVEQLDPKQAGPVPLWLTRSQIPDVQDIPRCPDCGAERTCEFQVRYLFRGINFERTDAVPRSWVLLQITCEAIAIPVPFTSLPLPSTPARTNARKRPIQKSCRFLWM
jgi:hypothetical protein